MRQCSSSQAASPPHSVDSSAASFLLGWRVSFAGAKTWALFTSRTVPEAQHLPSSPVAENNPKFWSNCERDVMLYIPQWTNNIVHIFKKSPKPSHAPKHRDQKQQLPTWDCKHHFDCRHQLKRRTGSGSLNHFLLPPGSLALNMRGSASVKGESPPTPLPQTILMVRTHTTRRWWLHTGSLACSEMWIQIIRFHCKHANWQAKGGNSTTSSTNMLWDYGAEHRSLTYLSSGEYPRLVDMSGTHQPGTFTQKVGRREETFSMD